MHRRFLAVAVAAIVAGMALAGCGAADNGGTIAEGPEEGLKRIKVEAAGFAFNPTAIELTVGEDVQFVVVNGDEVKHNLTVEGLDIDQDVEGAKTAESPVTTASKAGTYPYHCEYHPKQMQGTLTVT